MVEVHIAIHGLEVLITIEWLRTRGRDSRYQITGGDIQRIKVVSAAARQLVVADNLLDYIVRL